MRLSTLLLGISVIVIWGFSFIAIEIALETVSPWQLVWYRFIPTLPFFLPATIAAIRKYPEFFTIRRHIQFAILGFFSVIGYNVALNGGQTYLPASLAALVIALNPTSIALFAELALKEEPSPRHWIGLVVSLAGVAVVILGRGGPIEFRLTNLLGVLITVGAPLSWGIYSAGLRKHTPRIGAFYTTAVSMTYGTIPVAIATPFLMGPVSLLKEVPFTVSFLFLAIGCTVYGFSGWAGVLKRTEAAKAGLFIYFVPVIAAFGSWIILHEVLDLPFFAGTSLVLLGVAFATGRLNFLLRK